MDEDLASGTTNRSTAGGSCTTPQVLFLSRMTEMRHLTVRQLAFAPGSLNVGRWRAAASASAAGQTRFIPYETIQNREKERPHRRPFPQLPEMCLRLHGLERIPDRRDPFSRPRIDAVACAQLGVVSWASRWTRDI